MKSTKILAILVVGVISVSLLATVEKPDDAPKGKGWDQVWDALLDLQEQMDSIQQTPGPQGPPGPTLGIYDSLGLASSGGRGPGDAGERTLYNLGNVGIGTDNPEFKLEVKGDSDDPIISVTNDGTGSGVYGESESGFGVWGISTSGSGVVGYSDSYIGVLGRSLKENGVEGESIEHNGVEGHGGLCDFIATGPGTDYCSTSSIRWKSDVGPIDDPLGKVMSLRGVYFNWDKEHGGHHDVGMIAEEVGEVLPEIVQYEEDGKYTSGMDYGKLTPLLVEAVKQLRSENQALKQRIEALERAIPTNQSGQTNEVKY